MRHLRIGRASALAALLLWAAPASAQAPKAVPDGKALWAAHCSRCHGRTGAARPDYARKGTPDLNDPDWQKERSDAEIRKLIAEGSEGTLMEPFKGKLNEAEITALIQHIRKLPPPK
jgi:mono/diheme cytochrome c family protein